MSRIDPYRGFILETLAQFPALSAVRLFGMVSERGYHGSPEHFRHLIAGMRPRPLAETHLRRKRSGNPSYGSPLKLRTLHP